PTVQEGLAAGADVLCFSGDKLLGGPQAGIIVGKARYVEQMKKHPLLRALRVDKMTLAALEATLRLYRHPEEAVEKIPFYRMLAQAIPVLEERAARLLNLLNGLPGLVADMVESEAQIGAGSVPNETIPSRAVRLRAEGITADMLSHKLLQRTEPVASRIHKDAVLLDMRTVPDGALERLATAVSSCLKERG
ncbi:MAG: L-seryl-tRNA(Sec) selenium transferase, partial [Clostridia bacterium]|nr:L-seryl-tRNA(Sec) selenium transferase [Clostridia bacterium]